jgi:predicted nucleotidyltransferase
MSSPIHPARPAASDAVAIRSLRAYLADRAEIELAILVGSRAAGDARPDSDWDIAIRFQPGVTEGLDRIGRLEDLSRDLAGVLGVTAEDVDLIDLIRARLAMRAVVAEEGLPLKGEDSLAWGHFLTRTWRDLEDFYRERAHAA